MAAGMLRLLTMIPALLPLVFAAAAAASPATGPLRWITLPVETAVAGDAVAGEAAAGDFVLSFGVADAEALVVRLDHDGESRLLLVQTPPAASPPARSRHPCWPCPCGFRPASRHWWSATGCMPTRPFSSGSARPRITTTGRRCGICSTVCCSACSWR